MTTKTIETDMLQRREKLEEQFSEWPRDTIATHFSKVCELYKERPYIHMQNQSPATYGDVWNQARHYAKSLLALGVKRRDHIAILMENDPIYPSLMIAASLVGAVFIPINTMLRKDELGYILSQSDSRFLIMHQTIKGNAMEDTIIELMNDTNFNATSALQHVICLPNDSNPVNKACHSWHAFCEMAAMVDDATFEQRWQDSNYPDEVGTIMYTSGSTGKPKGVMLTHDMLLRCSYSTCLSRAIEDSRVTFAALPFYHCFNIIEGIFAMSFVGGSLISPPKFTPLTALELMERYKANDFLCVPSMLVPLLNHPRVSEFNLSNLFAMWCGAAPAPAPIWEKAINVLELTEVITGYGQTEVTSSGVTTEIGDSAQQISTRVGRPKLGGKCGLPEFDNSTVQYKTIDRDTGITLASGSIGELVVRGNTVTHGYYKKPKETADAIDKDGWLRTGDVGRVDENGYIEMLGRSKDLYKVSGELVAPREVEEVISQHPAVNHVFIVGVADSITTEAGAAFIELKADTTCTRKEITDWCFRHVARFKVPRHIWFIEASDWPMTSTGKVQKFRLKDMAEEKRTYNKGVSK